MARLAETLYEEFDAEYTAMAEAWLAEQERLIKLGNWESPRIEKTKDVLLQFFLSNFCTVFPQYGPLVSSRNCTI